MNKVWIVAKNEFYRYFISPLAYVYLICFLLLNGSFAFYFGHFFERGQADLLPMFDFQPWLYLLFIPGIAMRMWAEEFRSKTILQITTLPVSLPQLVWGKFLASAGFCALALVLTFPFWISVNLLGNADNAVIAAGYLGSFLLACCMLAISQTMSALTKNQVIALVLSVLANLFFFLSGLEYVLGLCRGIFSPALVDMIASFSFLTHFDAISRGLFELRDLVFFATLIVLFNLTTVLVVSFRISGTTRWLHSTRRSYYIMVFAFLLLAFCGLNLLANTYLRRFQIDFTQEKMFTLSPSTRRVIENLSGEITARLYFSPLLGERNPEARLFFDRLRLLLKQYAALSEGKIKLHVYDPVPLSNAEDRALAAGIQPLPIIDSSSNAYFGLTFSDEHDNHSVIPYFPLPRQNFAEQDLTEALYGLGRAKPKLGLLTSLPIHEQVIDTVATSNWEILEQLRHFYDVEFISNENNDLSGLDVLMIVHPRNLSPQTLKNIRLFSQKGGPILAVFDVATEAVRIFSPAIEEYHPSDYGTLPQEWGFRFLDQAVVADLDNSSLIDATVNYKTNPEFTQDLIQFYLRGESFNKTSPITAGLKKMMLTSASGFAPLPDADVEFEPLLQASRNSALFSVKAVYDSIPPAVMLRVFKPDTNSKYIAARIRGKKSPLNLIVVGDSDFLYDDFWTDHETILETNYAIPLLDNANFVFNALDVLRGEDTLLSLRGKTYILRPFTGVETARIEAARQTKIREKEIFDDIERAKRGMIEILAKRRFEGRQNFTPDELAVIAGVRKQIDKSRRALLEIQQNSDTFERHLKMWLEFYDIYALPLILLLILIVPLCRFDRRRFVSAEPLLNRRIFYIGAVSLAFLAAGLTAVFLDTSAGENSYEDAALFPNLPEQINNVSQIELKSSRQTLIFDKDADGRWQLKNAPHFEVYQNRIRSFLSALMEATYYEKKASGIENLSAFGLTPVETAGSPAVQVTLSGAEGEILRFNIGKYDMELGRGSRGAYIRFDNSFQVWLVQADFIDLSLNPLVWTYSTVWNLQFGRLISVNDHKDADRLAELVKEMLNIYFAAADSSQPAGKPFLSLNLQAENNVSARLDFYRHNDKYLLSYHFDNVGDSAALQDFAAASKGVCYEISAADMEKIKNAAAALGATN